MGNELEQFTYREILSQNLSWEATLKTISALPPAMVQKLKRLHAERGQPHEILFSGCGSTYYLALAAASFWRRLTGLATLALPASELWLYPEDIYGGDQVRVQRPRFLVAISRSGETTETLRALERYRERFGGESLGVTCYPESSLAGAATYSLVTKEAEEESIAQTRSFTSMFLLIQAAACIACGDEELLNELNKLPEGFTRLVGDYQALIKEIAESQAFERIVFLGSGVNYGLACEAMLKMKEISLTAAEAFHFLEFRHGPKSLAGPGTLIVGLVDEAAREHESLVLEEMRGLGAAVLAVSSGKQRLPADFHIPLGSGVSYLAERALTLPLLQLLAYHRAIYKGLNPDRPANLDAVVRLE
jgi:glucosamine--fructose-6-phosphate aminotransferase (isomerizing)